MLLILFCRARDGYELHRTETDSMPIEVRLATLSSRPNAPPLHRTISQAGNMNEVRQGARSQILEKATQE